MNPREQLEQHHLLPKKGLGQNFLHDVNVLEKIVAAAELTPDDTVLEIGAGTGTLTEVLAQTAKRVIAVEIDDRLRPILEERLSAYPNVEIIYNDILETDVPTLVGGDEYVVVANVPYYITSAIIRHLLESEHRPRRLVLTMQLEVEVCLIVHMGYMYMLSVRTMFFAQPLFMMRLNPETFWSGAAVDSAYVRMYTASERLVAVTDDKSFFKVLRPGLCL